MSSKSRQLRAPATIFHERRSKAVIGLVGHVLKRLGDGLMALFRYPAAQENDAERTARHFDE